ncbi:protein EFFECTOR OF TRANSCRIPTION 2-like isoform X2 [Phragmites australis]|uniref:protein EFFECTOR OF TRANSCRIPTION 2-like isoform X2 n=1 Tax=Phragmites australis TaxID=29695 RepID=UPI002D79D726|nr:protein EFFECTOR OF TRANSCRIPTION 2-like isoform X2 [Phragmites australis]
MLAAAAPVTRLKREDCPRTKHDSLFSPWKVLVGPLDWDDHSAGKEGVQRYRIRNLPDNFPGLYELGVSRASDEGVRARRHDSGGVVVVYLGQADNVRARLQQYGRTGSHLDTGNSLASAGKSETIALAAGPGLFREVFSRGYSVVFRCTLMDNKQEAEKTEAQLLRVFDYAWNKLQNGACRREEILLKLEQGAFSHRPSLLSRVRHMKQKVFGEKAGIKIKGSRSVDTSSGIMRSMVPRVRTFVPFRPRLVNSDESGGEAIHIPWKKTSEANTCGNRQAHRRRSEGYKVKNIDVAKRRTVPIQDSNSVCGVVLEDGSSCLELPVQGRKRCTLHKDQAQESELMSKNLDTTMKEQLRQSSSFEAKEVKTGEATTEDGADETSRDAGICEDKTFHAESESQVQQPSGRMWFELIKAQKKSASLHSSRGPGCHARVADDVAPICGAMIDNGSYKMVPIAERKTCEEHTGMKVTGASFSRSSGWPCTCGARTSDGSPCMNQPVEGRKRCALHIGQRASCSPYTIG